MTAATKQLTGKQEMQRYLEESSALERDLLLEKEKSKRVAWRVATAGMAMGFLGLIAGVAGLSQDAPPPTVLRVDNATGAVEEVSVMRETETSYGEAVDTYFINKFLLNRESYDYATIQTMYDTTRNLSGHDVWQAYNAIYTGPNARDVQLSNRTTITVDVRSIAIDPATGIATARYTTQKKHSNGNIEAREHWVATMSYTYVRAIMTTHQRRINPLGFVVTSFRADPEIVRN